MSKVKYCYQYESDPIVITVFRRLCGGFFLPVTPGCFNARFKPVLLLGISTYYSCITMRFRAISGRFGPFHSDGQAWPADKPGPAGHLAIYSARTCPEDKLFSCFNCNRSHSRKRFIVV